MSHITVPAETSGSAPSHSPPDVRYAPGISISRALGWFSIGLGLAELMLPEAVSRLTGVSNTRLLQFYGLRELTCGIGILSSERPTAWMWARVAGDACDLRTLGTVVMNGSQEQSDRATAAFVAVAGVTALDVFNAVQLSQAAALEG